MQSVLPRLDAVSRQGYTRVLGHSHAREGVSIFLDSQSFSKVGRLISIGSDFVNGTHSAEVLQNATCFLCYHGINDGNRRGFWSRPT
jgi:hypothetical protein